MNQAHWLWYRRYDYNNILRRTAISTVSAEFTVSLLRAPGFAPPCSPHVELWYNFYVVRPYLVCIEFFGVASSAASY